ncbi:MAG: MiaB/RimO family radical SAM methylthiotransferase [Lentisphaerae bacterium]|nr:MiaB/RimO family radical SAM methylthiotransferase [Lentisphaerota bacterium]
MKTIGCRLNQAESLGMARDFEAAGYEVVPFGARSDVVVIHGCAVTAKAEKDCFRLARAAARRRPRPFIVLAGCVAEIAGADPAGAGVVDLAAGQADKRRLPGLLAARGYGAAVAPGQKNTRAAELSPADPDCRTRALVKVQDGCDFRCAYCVVPAARGPSRSRPLREILEEVRALVGAGFLEVVLTGANIGCYDDGGQKLVALLSAIDRVRGLARFRISSIELSTVEREVIDFMAGSEKFCRFLHLPLQSGDDIILRAMRRRYSTACYRALIEYAAGKLGRVGLGADVIAGFPGEDADSFERTRAFVVSLPLSRLHVFEYSIRPGTDAAGMPGHVPAAERKRRVSELIRIGRAAGSGFARSFIGRPVSVLVEDIAAPGHGRGWTGEYVRMRVSGPGLKPNCIVNARALAFDESAEMLVGTVEYIQQGISNVQVS